MPDPQNSNHEPGTMVSRPGARHKYPQLYEATGGMESPRGLRTLWFGGCPGGGARELPLLC